jgi:hypothetical protein
MTAATYSNLSFENPPGTGPTLLSGSAEPYALTNGEVLSFSFAGEDVVVVFQETDFSNIANASASEVAAVIETQVDDISAQPDGGFVRLSSLLTGEDVTIDVVAGGANTVIGFPTAPVSGVTYDGGIPPGWVIAADVYTVTEWAGFADDGERPEEIFQQSGWLVGPTFTGEDIAGFTNAVVLDAEPFDDWSTTGVLLGIPMLAGQFSTIYTSDGFEFDWGTPTSFVLGSLTTGIDPEDYESDWNNAPVVLTLTNATFADGANLFDDFGPPVVDTTHIAIINLQAAGTWAVTINGEEFIYVASGPDTATDIASALATAITSGSTAANASNLFGILSIQPVDLTDTLVATMVAPVAASFTFNLATESSSLTSSWVGQDRNPYLD